MNRRANQMSYQQDKHQTVFRISNLYIIATEQPPTLQN